MWCDLYVFLCFVYDAAVLAQRCIISELESSFIETVNFGFS